MPEDRDLRERVKVRDRGLRRLRSWTGVLVVATAALAGTFTGIAAGTTPGRKLIRVLPPRTAKWRTPAASHSVPVPPPPSLPPLGSQAIPAQTPAPVEPPAAAPTATPVVVSGGS